MASGKYPIRNVTIWLTGISGAGKTTIASGVVDKLRSLGYQAENLDGDDFRNGLNKDLGFSVDDRKENIRRVAEVARLVAKLGFITVVSLISPLGEARKNARKIHQESGIDFLQVFVDTPLEECKKRDPKGLYKKCRDGLIKNFTGIDSPYERPDDAELVLKTMENRVGESINKIVSLLECKGCILPEKAVLPSVVYLNGSGDSERDQNGLSDKQQSAENSTVVNEEIILNSISHLQKGRQLKVKSESCRALCMLLEKQLNPCSVKELFVTGSEKSELLRRINTISRLNINQVDLQWVQVLSEGWATPLSGFMREKEYVECIFNGTTAGTENQTIPIVLSVTKEDKARLEEQKEIALWYNDKCYAVLQNIELYRHRKEERCARIFCTTDIGHPTIKMIYESGDFLVGGELKVFDKIKWDDGLDEYRLTPNELGHKFSAMKADAVYAFQVRNPIHNGHALLIQETKKMLLERGFQKPTLLLHPLGGWTKGDDVPLPVRITQHKAILEDGILDAENTVLAIFPSPMSYAGPVEVQWHCKARLVTGADFYIVGRDPAGIPHPNGTGDLYHPDYGSQVLKVSKGLSRFEIIPFKPAAYNLHLRRMDFFDSTQKDRYEFISGTKMRNLAKNKQDPPDGFMSKKGWKVLADFYRDS